MGLGDFFKGSASGLFSGAASLIGGGISAITGKSARDKEYERQKEFAQHGLRWKVADAKAAGIHPLYAIGAPAASYSPQSASGYDLGFSEMGQNISRAIEAKQTPEERYNADLQRENAELNNQLLRAQIGRTYAETGKINSDNLWSELDYVTRQARLSEAVVNTSPTQRPPAMPSTDPVYSVDQAKPGVVPYRYGNTYFDFPPEDVADTMEAPSAQAAWRGAVELAWRNDPTIREHYARVLSPEHKKKLKAGTHKLYRVPGIGVMVVPYNWTPAKSYWQHFKSWSDRASRLFRRPAHSGGGGI